MSGHGSGTDGPGRPVVERLRGALAARADSITVTDLRPADPPGPHLRRTPLSALRRRRFVWPLAGLATAAAVAVGWFTLAPGPEQRPLPATSPGPVEPPPTPETSGTPSVVPSSAPRRTPAADRPKGPGAGPTPDPASPPRPPSAGAPSRGAVPGRSVAPSTTPSPRTSR
ncbi:hypothetical protein [Streptomyces sp. NPDC048111]|uniref:hypothetical protein n=1 Tax=Streptomyces sp. NPDC048111 TaxID=3365500 RepID=UPI003723712E